MSYTCHRNRNIFQDRTGLERSKFLWKNKLKLAIDTIYDALTTVWEDNENIMADAVRDSVMTNLSKITGKSFEEIEKITENMVNRAQ
jgi:hypothetical protein